MGYSPWGRNELDVTDQLNAPKDPRIGKKFRKRRMKLGKYTDFRMSVKLQ